MSRWKERGWQDSLAAGPISAQPIVDADAEFDVTDDFPRRDVEDYRLDIENGQRQSAIPISVAFELEDDDVQEVFGVFGQDALKNKTLTLSKSYSNRRTYGLSVDEDAARNHVVRSSLLPEENKENLLKCSNWKELAEHLAAAEQTEEIKRISQVVSATAEKGASHYIYNNILSSRVPKFLYFDEYYQMNGHENIQSLIQREEADQLLASDYPLLGLIRLARLDIKDLLDVKRTASLRNKLEGAGNHLSRQILKYWSQNKHIQMRFDVREARQKTQKE